MRIRMRRVTRYVAPGQPVGAVAVAHPDVLGQQVRGVLGLDVVGSVLEAEQVSRRGLLARGRRRAAETQLRVAHRGGAERRPGPGCGWRAPPPAGRWRRPARRCLRRSAPDPSSRWGTSAGRPARPGADRRCRTGPCRPSRTRTDRSRWSASAPTAEGRAPHRCPPAARTGCPRRLRRATVSSPAVIRSAICVHSRSIATTLVAAVGGDVEGAEVHSVLLRRDDAGLPLPAERNGPVDVGGFGGGRGCATGQRARTGRADHGGGDARRADQPAPREAAALRGPERPLAGSLLGVR